MSGKLPLTGGRTGWSKLRDFTSPSPNIWMKKPYVSFPTTSSLFFLLLLFVYLFVFSYETPRSVPESLSFHWNFNPGISSVLAEVRNTAMATWLSTGAKSLASWRLAPNRSGDRFSRVPPLLWKRMCCWATAVHVETYHPSCTSPPNTGCQAFFFKLLSCGGGRKLSLRAHRCLESWNNIWLYIPPSVRWDLGHRAGPVKTGWDLVARRCFTVTFSQTDYLCTYVSVIPFSSRWFLTLSRHRGLCETPEPSHLRIPLALSAWWVLWTQMLANKPDDRSLLISWILRGVPPPTAATKPAAQNATRDANETASQFGSHTLNSVLWWSCVPDPFFCRHLRWLWTSATVSFCKGQGMLKLNLGFLFILSFFIAVYSLFWAPVLTQLLCFLSHTGYNTCETGLIIEALSLCLLKMRAKTQALILHMKSPQSAWFSKHCSHAFCMFCGKRQRNNCEATCFWAIVQIL